MISEQNRSVYVSYSRITHQKQQISEKGDTTQQYSVNILLSNITFF